MVLKDIVADPNDSCVGTRYVCIEETSTLVK